MGSLASRVRVFGTTVFWVVILAVAACAPTGAHAATAISGEIPTDTTWTLEGSPYEISADLSIPEGVALSIAPGVEVYLAQGVKIIVDGILSVSGSAASSVVFDGLNGDSWGQIIVASRGTARFSYTIFQNGGAYPFGGSGGDFIAPLEGLIVNGGSLTFLDSTIENTILSGGISSHGELAFARSGVHNVYLKRALFLGGTANIRDSAFASDEPISVDSGDVTLAHTHLAAPIAVQGSGVVFHDAGGNDSSIILSWNTSIDVDTTFPALPFVNALFGVSVGNGSTLTIPAGALVKSYDPIEVYGTLLVGSDDNGAATSTITSLANDSIGGDTNPGDGAVNPTDEGYGFGGIIAAEGSFVRLAHVLVSYGGEAYGSYLLDPCGGDPGADQSACAAQLLNEGGDVTIASSTFVHGLYNDIFEDAGTTVVRSSHFSTTPQFAYIRGGVFTASGNSVTNPTGVTATESPAAADARGNWWGTASGPFNSESNPEAFGPAVSAQVLFDPWLSADPFAPLPQNPCASATCLDSVLFIPGTETSRLYYRDELGIEHQLWEPSNWTQIPELAMNPDGTSVNEIYTKDIIGNLYDNRGFWSLITGAATHIDPTDLEVYGDFKNFMNTLVASSTLMMNSWQVYPYDWRYDVRDIVRNGTLTEESDGSLTQKYLEDIVGQMASSSATGKVTIVAHSNGGLIAKALMQKLEAEGSGDLVDQLILIGVPQWGTPVDIGAMLHGDGYTMPPVLGLVMYGGDVRTAARTMPGPYDLLPSSAYFEHVADPVALFDGGVLTKPFKTAFTHGITSFSDLVSFVTDAFGLNAGVGDALLLNTPLALDSTLLDKASATHTALDAWTPPPSLTVTAIAGWGQLTSFSYAYATTQGHTVCSIFFGETVCGRNRLFTHTPLVTEDGDNTVVVPSAAGDTGSVWYFDAAAYRTDRLGNIVHQNLTSAAPIQNTLLDLLRGKAISEDYMVSEKPTAQKSPLTIIGGMSPVNILATDSQGNESGIVPLPGTDLYITKHDIPGSAVTVSGDEKFVTLPQNVPYTISVSGYASGLANIQIQHVDADGSVTETTTLADIPITASSVGSFSLDTENTISPISFDLTGDGTQETLLMPEAGALVAYTVSEPAEDSGVSDPEPMSLRAAGGPGYHPYQAPESIFSMPPLQSLFVSTSTNREVETLGPSTERAEDVRAPRTTPPPLKGGSLKSSVHTASKRVTTSALKQDTHDFASPISTQRAAAYDALPQAQDSSVLASVYHWVTQEWLIITEFFARIL